MPEALRSLRHDNALITNEWPGPVGAALCWQNKNGTETPPGAWQYDYANEASEVELATLHCLDMPVLGLDIKWSTDSVPSPLVRRKPRLSATQESAAARF